MLLHFQSDSESTITANQEGVPIDGEKGGSTNTKFSSMLTSGSIMLLGTAIIRILHARINFQERIIGQRIPNIGNYYGLHFRIGFLRRKCESEIVGLSQSPIT